MGVTYMGNRDAAEIDASGRQHPGYDRLPFYTFRPPVRGYAPEVIGTETVRSRTRYVGAGFLAAGATIALVHGIYFTFDDHPVAFPMLNQVTVGIAIFAYIGAIMAFKGRHFHMASAGPLALVLVAVWDLTMQYLCFCAHQPIAGYVLILLIAVSWPLLYRSKSEFLD
jgi:hypothetical protein